MNPAHRLLHAALAAFLLGWPTGIVKSQDYDLVITGGRVIDPETGLDATRNLGIRNGSIAAITAGDINGDRRIDASGLIVAPGFIDLHEHGQSPEAYALMVRDGVTSAFELEVGTADIDGWYAERKGGQLVNYGVSIGHIPVRMAVMNDPGQFLPTGRAASEKAGAADIREMAVRLREGLSKGAVAVGFGLAYTPAATESEIRSMLAIAAGAGASSHVHIAGEVEGLSRTLAIADAIGAPIHVVHANSSAGDKITEFLDVIETARAHGQDVTTETYPYAAGMTELQSALFDDWIHGPDERFATLQWVATGERLTRESFIERRAEGGTVIIHSRTEAMTREAVAHPLTIIASDGFIENGRGHPRTSGSYSKVLGKYVREENVLTLMEALRKMTVAPARRLQARVPAMAKKGRIQLGADADLTLFDPQQIIDRSTYMDATVPSAGIAWVIIGGRIVVDRTGLIAGVRPGRAIRAPVD